MIIGTTNIQQRSQRVLKMVPLYQNDQITLFQQIITDIDEIKLIMLNEQFKQKNIMETRNEMCQIEYPIYNSKKSVKVLQTKKIKGQNRMQIQFNDWIILWADKDNCLGVNKLQNMQLSSIPINKNNKRNCYFRICGINQESKGKIQVKQQLYLVHVQSNLYVTAVIENLSGISYIILQANPDKKSIFTFKKSEDEQGQFIYDGQAIRIYSNHWGMYLKLTNPQKIQYDFSACLANNYKNLKIKIVKRQSEDYKKYLCNEDTVLIHQVKKRSYLGIKFLKDLLFQKVTDSEEYYINTTYFSKENCILQEYQVNNLDMQILKSCLWQVNRKTTTNDFLIKAKQPVMFRHVTTGLILIKNPQTYAFQLSDEEIHAPFKLYNSINYKFYDQIYESGIIYSEGLVEMEQINIQIYLKKIQSCDYIKLVNQNLLSFLSNLLDYLEGLTSSEETLHDFIKLYSYIYQLCAKNIQEMTDQGSYILSITINIMLLIKSKIQKYKSLYESPFKIKIIKPLIKNILIFLSVMIKTQVFQSILSKQRIKEVMKIVMCFYKIQQGIVCFIISLLAEIDPIYAVKILVSKFKAPLSLPFNLRAALVTNISEIMEKFSGMSSQWNKITNKIFQGLKYQITIDKIYISDEVGATEIDLLQSINEQQSENRGKLDEIMYLEELLKIIFYGRLYQITELSSLITNLLLLFKSNQSLPINRKITVLQLLNQLFFDYHPKISYIFTSNFIFYEGELKPTSNLHQILNYTPTITYFQEKDIRQLMESLQSNSQNSSLSLQLKYLAVVVETFRIFLSLGQLTISLFNQIQQFLIQIANAIFNPSKNSLILTNLSQKIANAKPFSCDSNIELQFEKLLSTFSETFKVILFQKKRILAYPLMRNISKIIPLQQILSKYLLLVGNPLLSESLFIRQIMELQAGRSQVVVITNDHNIDKLNKMGRVIESVQKIQIILKSVERFDHDARLTSELIIQIKAKVTQVANSLQDILPKNQQNLSYVRAFKISQKIFTVIFNSIHLEEEFTSILISFLTHYPPSFNTFTSEQITHYQPMFLRIIVKTIQNFHTPISSEQILNLLKKYSEYFKPGELVECTAVILEAWYGLASEEQYSQIYDMVINVDNAKQCLLHLKTLQTLKNFLNQTESNLKSKTIIQTFNNVLTILFRIAARTSHGRRHIFMIIDEEQVYKIINCPQIAYSIKSALLAYLKINKNKLNDLKFLQQNLKVIRNGLSEKALYSQYLDQYSYDNYLIRVEIKMRDIFPSQHIKKISSQKYRFDKKRSEYWQFIYNKPFYQQEQGILSLLQHILLILPGLNVPKTLLNLFSQIYQYLKQVKTIIKQFKGYPDLTYKITKLILLMEEIFPSLIQLRHTMLDEYKKYQEQLVHYIFTNQMVHSFFQHFSHYRQSSVQQLEQLQSEDSHQISRHALIIPVNQSSRKLDKHYMIYEILLILPNLCKSRVMNITLQKMMINYYMVGGSISSIEEQIKTIIKKNRAIPVGIIDQQDYVIRPINSLSKKISRCQFQQAKEAPIGCKFEGLVYLLQNNQTIFLFKILQSSNQYLFRTISIEELVKLIQKILMLSSSSYQQHFYEVQTIKLSLRIIYKYIKDKNLNVNLVGMDKNIIKYIYRISISSKKIDKYKIPEQIILMTLVEIYAQFQLVTKTFHPKLFEIVEKYCISKFTTSQLNYGFGEILNSFNKILNHNIILQLLSYTAFKNYIISIINSFCQLSINSANIHILTAINTLTIILDHLLLLILGQQVLNHPYFKQQLTKTIMNLQYKLYSSLFLKNKWQPNVSKQREEKLISLIAQCLNIFHNLSYISNRKMFNTYNMKDERLCMIKQKSQISQQQLGIYNKLEDVYQYVALNNKGKVMIYSYFVKLCVEIPWENEFMKVIQNQMEIPQRIHSMFKVNEYLMKLTINKSQPILNQIFHYYSLITKISFLLTVFLNVSLFYQIDEKFSDHSILEHLSIYLNIPIILLLCLAKTLNIYYLIRLNQQSFIYKNLSCLKIFKIATDHIVMLIFTMTLIGVTFAVLKNIFIQPILLFVIILDRQKIVKNFVNEIIFKRLMLNLQIIILVFSFSLMFQLFAEQNKQINILSHLIAQILGKEQMQFKQNFIIVIITMFLFSVLTVNFIYQIIQNNKRKEKKQILCLLCKHQKNQAKEQQIKHIKYQHNIFKYIAFMQYLLSRQDVQSLSYFQKKYINLIKEKSHQIFQI